MEREKVDDYAMHCGRTAAGEAGQSTVEFVLVTAGLLAVVLAFGLLGQKLEAGLFVQHALASASHHLCSLGSIADIFVY